MAAIHGDEFKRAAVRIALTSGLAKRQVAADLSVERYSLCKWVRAFSEESEAPGQDADLLHKNVCLRKENRSLKNLQGSAREQF